MSGHSGAASEPGFDAERVLGGLASFQRDTVEHVVDRLYRGGDSRRFLVADETGLGKSLVARGVIARAVEALEQDDSVRRIDIVYVCSNSDIAKQNLSRLDVTGQPHVAFASRLTLLAKAAAGLRKTQEATARKGISKPVNLVSFTPGTSFETGWQTGTAEERALLFLLLRDRVDLTGRRRYKAALHLLRRTVRNVDVFERHVQWLGAELGHKVDPTISEAFFAAPETSALLAEFDRLVGELGAYQSVPEELGRRMGALVGNLRSTLARASVQTLEPDLVILDEFQRFRTLLDASTPAGELAHHMFNYPQARVLLLSATPYKPFTYAEESSEDDHHRDFLQTVKFLAGGSSSVDVPRLSADLAEYRRRVVDGHPVDELVDDLRTQLLAVMSRQERPDLSGLDLFSEHADDAAEVTAADLVGFVGLRALATKLDAPVTTDYWKSGPYFLNFSDGYQFGTRLREALADPERKVELRPIVQQVPQIDADDVRAFREIDFGNARLRRLAHDTVGGGWWRLLWVPPSLPYLAPGGPYAEPWAGRMTKRLVFSSWSATPTAVASLLSYDAARRIAAGSQALHENTAAARASLARRFTYSLDGDRPQAMTTLALFWPSPWLARLGDPLDLARAAGGSLDPQVAFDLVEERLRDHLPWGDGMQGTGAAWYWAAPVALPGGLPVDLRSDVDRIVDALSGVTGAAERRGAAASTDEDLDADGAPVHERQTGLRAHVEAALAAMTEPVTDRVPADLAQSVAALALNGPGNCAWRALSRLLEPHGDQEPSGNVSEAGLWEAAAVLANGLRSVFARWESTLLLDGEVAADVPYWRAVLTYCGWGNLQAVLDEYLHHLVTDEGIQTLDDQRIIALARRAAEAIAVRVSPYEAFDPTDPTRALTFPSRFALRYGGRRVTQEDARQPEVRRAFNSPFWPFVLASTSVGQEGIDLHWWCHAVVHWNTPANPVDFEQREGRVNRYGGHAVRKNIATRHAADIFASGDPNPWHAAYHVATDEHGRCGDFAPHWVYPGPARIERHLVPFPLSVDRARYERLKEDVALYRLTFGQPRQEDMLELLRERAIGSFARPQRVDLRPPVRCSDVSTSQEVDGAVGLG